jgi:cytochrome oxidase assembly protein ShyY1
MSPHALTFPVIMLGLGLWQFRRAGRMAQARAEIEAANVEERRIYDAHGYPPTDPARVRLIGAGLLVIGVGYFVVAMLL